MRLFWKLFITMLGFVIAAFMVFGNIIINIPFKSSIERETDRSVEEMHILLYAFTASLDGLPDGYRASGLAVTEITKSLEKNLGNNNNIIVYNEDKEIIGYEVNPKVIKMLEVQSDSVDSNTGIVKIDGEKFEQFTKTIEKISSKKTEEERDIVLVAPQHLRHMLFVLVSELYTDIPVICLEEITPEFELKILGSI